MVKDGYKQTEIGKIPKDWELLTVNDTLELLTDFEANGSFETVAKNVNLYDSSNFAWYVRATDLEKKSNLSEVKYVDKSSYVFLQKTPLYGGEVLITKRGEIGKVYYFKQQYPHATLAPNMYLLKLNTNIVIPQFVYYFFKSKVGKKLLLQKNASSTLGALYKDDVKAIHFPLPPKKEQKAIAKALSDTDELINSLEKLISKKEAIKQGTMQQLLSSKKRLSGFTGNWEVFNLEDMSKTFTKQTGFDYSSNIKPTLIQRQNNGYVPFIQNKDFEGKLINYETDYYVPENVAKKFPRILLNEKCLLISISGSIGNVGVFNNIKTAFIGGAVAVVKFKDKDLLDWCMYYLLSNEGQNKLVGNVKAGSHQNLILDDLRKIEIPIPKKEEQQAVVQILLDIDNEIEVLKSKLSKTKAIKDGMMSELLAGKTRLQEVKAS